MPPLWYEKLEMHKIIRLLVKFKCLKSGPFLEKANMQITIRASIQWLDNFFLFFLKHFAINDKSDLFEARWDGLEPVCISHICRCTDVKSNYRERGHHQDFNLIFCHSLSAWHCWQKFTSTVQRKCTKRKKVTHVLFWVSCSYRARIQLVSDRGILIFLIARVLHFWLLAPSTAFSLIAFVLPPLNIDVKIEER